VKLALGIIGAAVIGVAIAGGFVLRGGEYVMFLFALAMVTFFGSLPVVLGVLTRSRGGVRVADDDQSTVVVRRSEVVQSRAKVPGGGAASGASASTPASAAAGRTGADLGA
jgi:hypothetical protein